MRMLFWVITSLLLSCSGCSSAQAGDEQKCPPAQGARLSSEQTLQQAQQVVTEWAAAFTASDVDGITALYAPDAHFIGTRAKNMLNTTDAIRAYFVTALEGKVRTAEVLQQAARVASADVVDVTVFDRTTSQSPGSTTIETQLGRTTFEIENRNGKWVIGGFQRALLPE